MSVFGAPAVKETAAVPDQAALLERARGGDVRAFELLYRMLSPRVYGLCLRLARDSAEAQDCTQDTFVTAWRMLGEFRGDAAIGTWLHRIAVNEVLGRRRKQATEARHLKAVGATPETPQGDSATLEDLERAIAKLPERARDVFVLRAVYGHTHEEIAGLLEVTVSTSKTHYLRARHLLAASLPGARDRNADEIAAARGAEGAAEAAE
jgi:RNA polymerase sigma-70 factor (ECF subfamily)